jgi:hypothetical protein
MSLSKSGCASQNSLRPLRMFSAGIFCAAGIVNDDHRGHCRREKVSDLAKSCARPSKRNARFNASDKLSADLK